MRSRLLNFKTTARTEPFLPANLRTMFRSFQNFLIPEIPKMCDPILVTVLKMQPHYSQSSSENATPSSGTSPIAFYKELPPPPREGTSVIRSECMLDGLSHYLLDSETARIRLCRIKIVTTQQTHRSKQMEKPINSLDDLMSSIIIVSVH